MEDNLKKTSRDPLARIHSFPPSTPPNHDPASIRGNISPEHKRLAANTLSYHLANRPGSRVFANDAVKGLKLVEINVRKKGMGEGETERGGERLEAEATCEVLVEEGMLNVHGTLAGGCAAHLIDFGTFGAMFSLGFESGFDASGVSTSMNLNWHSPALPGMTLRIVSTSISSGGRLSTSRAEIYDKRTGHLLVSAIHVMAPLKDFSQQPTKPVKSRL